MLVCLIIISLKKKRKYTIFKVCENRALQQIKIAMTIKKNTI